MSTSASSSTAFRRVVRRESHSPRTAAMIIAVILAVVVLAYIGVELVLSLFSRQKLLVSPADAGTWLTGLAEQQPVWAITTAAGLTAVVGIVFVVVALAPGRLPKHQLVSEGHAVLVDNGVIAAALAQHLSDHTGIGRDRITVGVSRRIVDVSVAPDAGAPVAEDQIRSLVATELESYQLAQPLKTHVRRSTQRKGAPA